MSSDPFDAYQAAVHALELQTREADRLAALMSEAASAMRSWRTMRVTSSGLGLPQARAGIDTQTWPTGQQVVEVLSRWHELKREADDPFRRIRSDDSSAVHLQ